MENPDTKRLETDRMILRKVALEDLDAGLVTKLQPSF